MIGTKILHYRIDRKLGEGGMGAVYLATDTKLDRKVAIKLLSPDRASDPESRQRFIHEAKAEAMLSHPNIVTFYEVGEAENQAFIVMEYVEGQSLPDYVQSQRFSVSQILDLVIQAGEGLQAAHDKSVIHRDIKPDNIMVTPKGHVKLTDFGLARWKGATTITKTGTRMGTAVYMSPEQAEGRRLDHRSDIFSLGVVLYELLCNQRPFEGDSEAVVVYEILNTQPQPLARFNRDVPDELERIVTKCLSKTPDERYQSTADLVADLKHQRRIEESAVSSIAAAAPPTRKRGRTGLIVSASVVVFAVIALFVFKPWQADVEPNGEAEVELKLIAVLPFENLGSKEDEYFADGVTEAITSRLAGVSAMRVISRTSAMQYKNTDKTIPQIGEELGVDYILEGTILWDKSGDTERVRITPQLIEVASDFHIWADNIERPRSGLFELQAAIATHITEALGVTLLEPEKTALKARPTENPEAYDLYLRAQELARQVYFNQEHWRLVQLLQRAVALDPDFALAYAALSRAHNDEFFEGRDRTEERAGKTLAAAQAAVALQPELPEAHLALGWYHYRCNTDYDAALSEFELARLSLPHDSRVMYAFGTIYKRQGRFEEAIDYFKIGQIMDPRDVRMPVELGVVHGRLRRYSDEELYIDRTIALAPEVGGHLGWKAWNRVARDGAVQAARAIMEKNPQDFESVAWYFDLLERDFESYLERLTSDPDSVDQRLAAYAYRFLGEVDLAHTAFDSARVLLEAQAVEQPDKYLVHSRLGIVYAGLGRKTEAIREGKLAAELMPVTKDAMMGPEPIADLARIYVVLGEYEDAMDQLEYLLSIPSAYSVHSVRLDPWFDPLHELPRFQTMLEKGHTVF